MSRFSVHRRRRKQTPQENDGTKHITLLLLCWLAAAMTCLGQQQNTQRKPPNAQRKPPNAQRKPPNAQRKPLLVSIRSVLDREAAGGTGPVLLRGTITHAHPQTVLQDQTGAVELRTDRPYPLTVGDEAEVVGSSLVSGAVPAIQATSIQTLWHSSPPLPLAITPDRAADGRYNLHYVQTTGVLTRIERQKNGATLSLQGDHQFFTGRLEQDVAAGAKALSVSGLEVGTTMRLNGILLVSHAQFSSTEGSFVLLVSSPDDLEVVHGPDWWNVRHVTYLFLLATLLGVSLQLLHLQQVKRQYDAVLSERARIARDIHDTLAQGFAGIALQLEVVRGKLQEGDAATQHLGMALRMVQHSRAEAHRSIAALRAFSREMPLQTMLETMIRHLQDVPGQSVELAFVGDNGVLLTPLIAENVYRIVQELASNAQQHASASKIRVEVGTRKDRLQIVVEDNGVGMAPELLHNAPPAHFGLLGVRERVQTMRGSIQASRLQPGTAIVIQIPVQERRRFSRRFRWRKGIPLGNVASVIDLRSNLPAGGRHA